MTFFLLFKCSKVCYWQEKIVNKGCNLLNPYLLMVLLSIPFYKLPCTMASFSGIFVVSISVTHYKRLWIPRSWRHFFCLSDNSLVFFSLIIPMFLWDFWCLSVSYMIYLKISLLTINSLSLSHCTPREFLAERKEESAPVRSTICSTHWSKILKLVWTYQIL